MTASGIGDAAVATFAEHERRLFLARNPRSTALSGRARGALFGGVPMHWMADWSTPCPLFAASAGGAHLVDVDGHDYVDFCLGDTAAMFGHSPAPIAGALATQGRRGLSTMLPGEDAVVAGELLGQRFGLPYWQLTATATDANRAVLRWARAITGRATVVVFDGCYHGTVEDTLVRLHAGRTVPRPGLIGQVFDATRSTRVVPFNDPGALEQALAPGDVAAVLCEPALTNIGMVLPQPGFLAALRAATRRHGTLLILDETHTLSTGPGGCTRAWKLEPDLLTVGKAIAGGMPAAVYGCSAEAAAAMERARAAAGGGAHGHSGMGTTLAANALALRCLRVNLEQVMSDTAWEHMLAQAARLADGLRALIARHGLAWSVTALGARCEFQFCAEPPRDGAAAQAAFHDALQMALHLYLINRGVLITPFHNMTLCSPHTTGADVSVLLTTLDAALATLLALPGARQ